MAHLRIPDESRAVAGAEAIRAELAARGIDYDTWTPEHDVAPDAPPEEILAAYAASIDGLKERGGYVTADVVDLSPETPDLAALEEQFSREHWHDEDEVRFILSGHGLFHLRPGGGPVLALEVEAGDRVCVPRRTRHWFHLCADRRIRAIRLFQTREGWTPHYTGSGVDQGYRPLCLGPGLPGPAS